MKASVNKSSRETYVSENAAALSILIAIKKNGELTTSDLMNLGLTSPNSKGKLAPLKILLSFGFLTRRERAIPGMMKPRMVYFVTKLGLAEIDKCRKLGMEEFLIPSLAMFFRYKDDENHSEVASTSRESCTIDAT